MLTQSRLGVAAAVVVGLSGLVLVLAAPGGPGEDRKAQVVSSKKMIGRAPCFLLAIACLGCGGTISVAPEGGQRFCELTIAIDRIYAEANDQQLSPEAARQVAEAVAELAPLVPAAHSNDYRLRYWPTTDVSGLDTSGVSTQRAYDRMKTLFDETCGPS
jgi:hypothetical protein